MVRWSSLKLSIVNLSCYRPCSSGELQYSPYYEHLPFISALLASVSTITTIGLYVPNGGNFFTINTDEAMLLIIMIIVSVGAGASILQSVVGTVAKW